MATIMLPFGKSQRSIDVPDRNYLETLGPLPAAPVPDEQRALEHALSNPIGGGCLEDVARGARDAVVVVDDFTRPTPVAVVLPHVIDRLHAAGLGDDQITIVVALGTHRAMTADEVTFKLGADVVRAHRVVNSSVHDAPDYDFMGTSKLGVEIWMLRDVARADLRVGIGSIVPHCDVGYAGGGKILLPGVCAARTVAMNHIKGLEFHGHNYLGASTTLIRQDIEDVVGKVGLNFIVNCVTTAQARLYGVVCGDFIQAHRVGVQLARQIYGVPAQKRADITIASSHPGDADFIQVTKAIWCGDKLTRPGGDLIVLTPCSEGVGPYVQLPALMAEDHHEVERRIYSGEIGADMEGVTAAQAVRTRRLMERIRISLVTSGLPRNQAEAMGFRRYETLESALADALSRQGPDAYVSLITHGGDIVPMVAGEELL